MKQEKHYWDNRYCAGKDSGPGSRGGYRKWKWKVINSVVKDIRNKTVLDVGCGDLQFLKKRKLNSYLGLDISPTIITRNRKKRPDLNFGIFDVTENNKQLGPFQVVLCMDLLFHIMEEERFKNLLRNLNRWTGEYLFIVNWCKNPLKSQNDGEYQAFRDLTKYLDWFTNLRLIDTFQRPSDPYNMIYVFRRRSK